MSAEPISHEQLRVLSETGRAVNDAIIVLLDEHAGAMALRGRVQNVLALLDGNTRHEGLTDADHLRVHRAALAEIQTALDLTRPRP